MPDRQLAARLALSRRHLLRGFGAAAVTAFALPLPRSALAQPIFRTYPFQLGVASGEPMPDGFVIWTRLAPEPLAPGHGMPAQPIEIQWEVAEDERFQTIVRKGNAVARPELGHAVHVEVAGLAPSRPYWYRFIAGRERSFPGRAMTAPAPGAAVDRLRFAVAGCQAYDAGHFTAHRELAAEGVDFVFCYGDYIYEGRSNRLRNGPEGPVEVVRPHEGDEPYTLDDYRRRYAQYKMDADLQAAHAAAPWLPVWDDHETDNNWAAAVDQDGTPPALFALRRQAAAQAYYEHMPLRPASFPVGPAMQIYRRARFGDLLDLDLLDTRQYRTPQPCDGAWASDCAEAGRREADMLGARQHAWLMDGLRQSRARWNVLAQQVMVMDLDRDTGPSAGYNLDSWAGYRTPRTRLLEGIRDSQRSNVVVLTGDEHQNFAGELHLDGRRPGPRPIAVEFVATSITSGGDGEDLRADMVPIKAANDQLKFVNSQRGYLICDVDRERFQAEFKVLDRVSTPGGTLTTRKTMVVLPGEPRLVDA
ncbi:alkaline phosphatase D family protein [Allosphingosinicella deserti]|uniref:Alkaline phosphatase n=1 Tax=Allosphingosinicella deserti TaxID=2116704 RepID=A0A2P7QKN8_9SPHN|nr:alkaline phosphatase D family protein [Sphingomonas deserti]PSJ38524.1 alkaline phosphatase [Sphingomonas deserti]